MQAFFFFPQLTHLFRNCPPAASCRMQLPSCNLNRTTHTFPCSIESRLGPPGQPAGSGVCLMI